MKRQWMMGVSLACAGLFATALAAQTPAVIPLQGVPLTGTPDGAPVMAGHNTTGFPAPAMVEGQPIETRAPELTSDHPAFPGQTRVPYHASVRYNVTTLTDQLKMPWSLAFLPDGKMLVTEKPGTMRIIDGRGNLSQPLAGVPAVNYQSQVGLLDVVLDPRFARNHRIFFSYSEPLGDDSDIVVARADLDEAAGALTNVKVIFHTKPALPRSLGSNEGGRIAIGRDGDLFVIVGDRSKSPPWLVAQQLDTDLGKMIHITPDGARARQSPSPTRRARCRKSGRSAIAARKA